MYMRKNQTSIILLLNPGPTALHSIVNSQETRVGRKGKVILFQMLATEGEGGLVSGNQLPIAVWEADVSKGEFQCCMDRGREQDGTVISISVMTVISILVMMFKVGSDSDLDIGDNGHS